MWGEEGRAIAPPQLLRFASGVGGDMDGNPNVTAEAVLASLARHRELAPGAYRLELVELAGDRSQSATRVIMITPPRRMVICGRVALTDRRPMHSDRLDDLHLGRRNPDFESGSKKKALRCRFLLIFLRRPAIIVECRCQSSFSLFLLAPASGWSKSATRSVARCLQMQGRKGRSRPSSKSR